MRNDINNLPIGKNKDFRAQTKMERWLNRSKMVAYKFLFWLCLFFMIIVEVDGQCTAIGTGGFTWSGTAEGTMTSWNLNNPLTGYAPDGCH